MIATFTPCRLAGTTDAPPSKSMAHRYLIGAALSGKKCTLHGVDYSEDILASIDCLKALGAEITTDKDKVTVDPVGFMQAENPVLECRESGSTLRFFIPLALCLGKAVTLHGSKRLFEIADSISEIKTICACGSKATVNARFDKNMKIVTSGHQVMIGGNEKYVAMCHRCWHEAIERQKNEQGENI